MINITVTICCNELLTLRNFVCFEIHQGLPVQPACQVYEVGISVDGDSLPIAALGSPLAAATNFLAVEKEY